MNTLVEIDNVSVRFKTTHGWGYAVTNVSAMIPRHRTIAIVGESGSGKSVLGSAIVGLLPPNAEFRGRILFSGRDLGELSEKEWNAIRGTQIGWVSQNPLSALNPVFTLRRLVAEGPRHHRILNRKDTTPFVHDRLRAVGLNADHASSYAFELSGGMAQRALIASGLASDPSFVILDEPTKGLDSANVARVRDVVASLASTGTTILLITHDVGLAHDLADEIWVFYGSCLVEQAGVDDFFANPLHPYSQGLLAAMPSRGLHPIPGESPSFFTEVTGCPFEPRCEFAREKCGELDELRHHDGRRVRCLLP